MKILKVHDGFPRIRLLAATEKRRRMDEGRVDTAAAAANAQGVWEAGS
jgi:hypothetical protein